MTRPSALLAASAALAALALTGCSDSGSVSGAPTSLPSSSDVGASASSLASSASSAASSAAPGASSAVASATDQLSKIKDCLQKANLPTPSSTDATGLLQELPKLIQNPQVRQALQQCNIPLTG